MAQPVVTIMARNRKSIRGSIVITCILIAVFCLLSFSAFLDKASAAPVPWPADIGTDIGVNLPPDYEPSGVVWSPKYDSLFLVSDNGNLTKLDTNGNIAS
ncbi:MAG: hypothetical protein JXA49_06845, partial [Actinobacteria bacterium]|nr:hypothetical protein [Actinomycetota bacterium]